MEIDSNKEDNISKTHNMSFYYKRKFEHIIDFIKIYPQQLPMMFAFCIAGWAVIEILYTKIAHDISEMIFPLFVLSVIYSFYLNIKKYNSSYPDVLSKESRIIKKYYVIQKVSWQYKIAFEKLKDLSIEKTIELKRIKSGREYIKPIILSVDDYLDFIRTQPQSIIRLVQVAKLTCIEVLPEVISNAGDGDDKNIINMMNEIEYLKYIYEQTIDFERNIYSIIPPEQFEELHQFVFGWSEPIIDGLNQFVENLRKFSLIKKSDFKKGLSNIPETTILFDLHENINKFNDTMEQVMSDIE